MIRTIRRVLGVTALAAVASVGFVGVASAPAGADAFGYTVQVQFPLGFPEPPAFQCRLAKVDLATGALTPIGGYLPSTSFACAKDLAFAPNGALYGIAEAASVPNDSSDTVIVPSGPTAQAPPTPEVHLVRFDTTTGAVTDLGAIGTAGATLSGRAAGGITFDAAGRLWVYMVGFDDACDHLAFCLYQVDPANPANSVFKGRGPIETFLFGLTANCAGDVFTLEQGTEVGPADDVNVEISGNFLDSVDTSTGAATKIGPSFGTSRFVQSIDFGADGVLYGIGTVLSQGFGSSTGYVYTLNPSTGSATLGAKLSAASSFTFVQGLAVAPLDCQGPPPPAVTPAFTG